MRADGDLAFRVREPAVLGLHALKTTEAGMVFLSEDDCIPADDEDYSGFSLPPVQGLILAVGCSGQVNHILLGHMAVAFAQRLHAMIDFDGVLGYTPGNRTQEAANLARARALVASLPGTVREVSYDTGGGDRWIRHVGDLQFLSAWLQHPDFRLVK
ncbi:DUF6368 family protein [Streptomyces antibioticus]|uniref:DUF6368 family protein n=1 Tax=Streptomyces antibioticus TaxID=1890 RepID=UPI00224FBBCC|nr:DUF6368 family protein [Streptomyces antibioticus]MCX4740870.1 DUF6368 family protein [Streptomyces antibioticus]